MEKRELGAGEWKGEREAGSGSSVGTEARRRLRFPLLIREFHRNGYN